MLSAAALVAAVLLAPEATPGADVVLGCVVLSVLAVVAESFGVELTDRVTITAANLPILLAIMFLGPAPAMVVAGAAGIWGFWRERSPYIALFNASNYVLAAAVGALVFIAFQHGWGFSNQELSSLLLVAGVIAAAAYEASNLGIASLGASMMYGRSPVEYWKTEYPPFLRSLAVLTALGLMAGALYARWGLLAVVLLLIPLLASQYMFRLLVREKEHVAQQKRLSDQYMEMNIGLAAAMVVLLDSKDEYTAQHSAAVAMYCRDMAVALGLPAKDAEALHLAGLLHDLGKVGTPDAVLGKASALDEDDWGYIRQHPEKGAEVLSHLANYDDVVDIVRYHHERLDGTGYPRGVLGDEIPEMSKILAVADSYHAMTSDRPYRDARSSFEALKELRGISGSKLEREYVEVLAKILRDKDLAYRDGTSTDFTGEYERGRINLRLRGRLLADLTGDAEEREGSRAG